MDPYSYHIPIPMHMPIGIPIDIPIDIPIYILIYMPIPIPSPIPGHAHIAIANLIPNSDPILNLPRLYPFPFIFLNHTAKNLLQH